MKVTHLILDPASTIEVEMAGLGSVTVKFE